MPLQLHFQPGAGLPGSTVFQALEGTPKFRSGVMPNDFWFYPLPGTQFFMGVPTKHRKRLENAKSQQEKQNALRTLAASELRAARTGAPSPGDFLLVTKTKKGFRYNRPTMMGQSEKRANGDMIEYFSKNPDKLREKQERDKRKMLKKADFVSHEREEESARKKLKLALKTKDLRPVRAALSQLERTEADEAKEARQALKHMPKVAQDPVTEVPRGQHPVKLQKPIKRTGKDAKYPFQAHIDFQGLKIDVENTKGSYRKGKDKDGNEWKTYMHAHYGEIRDTTGVDGDNLDVYVGPNHDSALVVVIHQHNPWDGKYDEDKVVVGCDSLEEAIGLYKKQYDKPGFYKDGKHTVMSIGQFWRWVHDKKKHGKKVASALVKLAAAKKRPAAKLLDGLRGRPAPKTSDRIGSFLKRARSREAVKTAMDPVKHEEFVRRIVSTPSSRPSQNLRIKGALRKMMERKGTSSRVIRPESAYRAAEHRLGKAKNFAEVMKRKAVPSSTTLFFH